MYGQESDPLTSILIVIVLVLVYFLPSVVAYSRAHKNKVAIFFLNLLAGWTFVGWVAAFVWIVAN